MQTPMELLSPMTTRADSGKGIEALGQNSRQSKSNRDFNKAFTDELDRHDRKMQKPQLQNQSHKDSKKYDNSVDRAKQDAIVKAIDDIDDKDAELAVGVINTITAAQDTQVQAEEQEIVIIPGGEEPEEPAARETTAKTGADGAQQPRQDTGDIVVNEEETYAARLEDAGKDKTGIMQESAQATQQLKETIAAKSDTQAQLVIEDTTEQITARMPEVKSEDKSNSDANQKDDGNPGFSYTENESTKAEGQKDEAYSKAVDAVRSKTEEKPADSAVNNVNATEAVPIPLSEGIKPEQFRAGEQMTKAAVEHAVKPENLFEEMISRVESNLTAAKSTMTIQLNPEFLGKVALEVAVDASGVHVKINAEDSNVRGMINSQIAMLIESLENKGIAVSEVEVVFAGANFDNLSQPGGDGRQESSAGGGRSGGKENRAQENIEYYTTLTDLMDYYLDAGVSSVEYRA